MDSKEDYLNSLLNSVMSQESKQGGAALNTFGLDDDNDVAELLDTASGESELDEINNLLKKSDQSQMMDDEMLAMLERADQETEANLSGKNEPEAFDIFASEGLDEEDMYLSDESELSGDSDHQQDSDLSAESEFPQDIDLFAENGLDEGTDTLVDQELGQEMDTLADQESGQEVDIFAENGSEQEMDMFAENGSGQEMDIFGEFQEQEIDAAGNLPEDEVMPVAAASGADDADDMDAFLKDIMPEEQTQEEDGGTDWASDGEMLSLDSLQTEEESLHDFEMQDLLGEAMLRAGEHQEPSEPGEDLISAGEDAEEEAQQKKRTKKEKKRKRSKDSTSAAAQEGSQEERPQADDFGDVGTDFGAEGENAGKLGKAKKAKKEKIKKEKVGSEESGGEKKPGFFAKILHGLLEEVGEEDSDENQEMSMSDENREILAMMEGEKIENGKPDKKKKAKKGKKPQKGDKQGSEEGDEELSEDGKKAKKVKAKKEKKPKPPKEKKETQPTKKLPKGKVFSVVAVCLTLLAGILLLSNIIPSQSDLKKARKAYYNGDYMTVYQNMAGKELSNSDYILYMRSLLILNMQSKLDNYPIYMSMDKEMVALNELMLAVDYYQSNNRLAEEYGALDEMTAVYDQVLALLWDYYQVSEEEAIEIFALDDLGYNQRLYYLVHGTEFKIPETQEGVQGSTDGNRQIDSSNVGQSQNGNSGIAGSLREEEQPKDREPGLSTTDAEIDNRPEQTGNGSSDIADSSDGAGSSDSAASSDVAGSSDSAGATGASSQTDGQVIYSGEVRNGNAVVQ